MRILALLVLLCGSSLCFAADVSPSVPLDSNGLGWPLDDWKAFLSEPQDRALLADYRIAREKYATDPAGETNPLIQITEKCASSARDPAFKNAAEESLASMIEARRIAADIKLSSGQYQEHWMRIEADFKTGRISDSKFIEWRDKFLAEVPNSELRDRIASWESEEEREAQWRLFVSSEAKSRGLKDEEFEVLYAAFSSKDSMPSALWDKRAEIIAKLGLRNRANRAWWLARFNGKSMEEADRAKQIALMEEQNDLLASQGDLMRKQLDAQNELNDQMLSLRIQQAYPENPAMWRYLERNPRYIEHYLQDR